MVVHVQLFQLADGESAPRTVAEHVEQPSFGKPIDLVGERFASPRAERLYDTPPLANHLMHVRARQRGGVVFLFFILEKRGEAS